MLFRSDDEEEEDLGDDDSWSSRGSSLYLPDSDDNNNNYNNNTHPLAQITNNLELHLELQISTSSGSDQAIQRTTTKRKKDNQNALDWLQTLQQDGVTEAASSKFLTGGLPVPVEGTSL